MTDQSRKLIEVALPLDEINAACKADKDRKTGTIRNLHKWFAPMPLPAWRALIYAALIDDPADDEKRAYHLDLIKRLVANGADLPDQDTLEEARRNLERQFPEGVPLVMDPFCGGGSTLVEAQRLGLPTYGSDLNPVPVLITRTLTELLPKIHGQQPLHPEMVEDATPRGNRRRHIAADQQESLIQFSGKRKFYSGYDGLIRDVTYYAERIRNEAWEQLRDHYPSQKGESPIAWLWARTAKCPNPACGIETILTTSWSLSKRKGGFAWLEPHVVGDVLEVDIFQDQLTDNTPPASKNGRGATFACTACGGVLNEAYVIEQGIEGRMGLRMLAVLASGREGRHYRVPNDEDRAAAASCAVDGDFLDIALPDNPRWFSGPRFGFMTQRSLYSDRQVLTLVTLADLIRRLPSDIEGDGGSRAQVATIVTVMGLILGKAAGFCSSQTRIAHGDGGSNRTIPVFARHDLPMSWDFPEINILGADSANWMQITETVCRAVAHAPTGQGQAVRADARIAQPPQRALVATDPPYFDAIGYADLSDYFYVWHRRALRTIWPDLFATVATPKTEELTAIPAHHGNSRDAARDYFIDGFTDAFRNLQNASLAHVPMLIVYASKEQTAGAEETRWASILTATVNADLEITGTWPIHGARASRMIGIGTNAVAAYVVMVTRPRPDDAGTCSLADFNRALRRELKPAVSDLQAAGILPVDLAQAAMGPGMQVYSRYRSVLDQTGNRVPVEQALRLINQALSEVLDEQEGELDPDSRFAVTWWEKHCWDDGSFGEADKLARPHGISVDDVIRAGVAVYPKPGFVKVVGNGVLDRSWMPVSDARPTAWEAVHHLADRLIDGGGTTDAGALMAQLGNLRDQSQALVYRLHAIAARKGWTKDQERYNSLIGSWSDLLAEAGRAHGEALF